MGKEAFGSLRNSHGIWKTICLLICYTVTLTPNDCAGQKILWACDFSKRNLCGAFNISSQTSFQFGSGETPSEGTGPSGDHTLERVRLQQQYGSHSEYIYLEASWAQQEDTAVLRLPLVPIVEEACLTFYYHMYSSDGWEQGNLKVTISRDSVPVWFVSGNKGPFWQEGKLTLPANTVNIQFIAARGSGLQSDIALDDMMIITGSCLGPPMEPLPPPPLPYIPTFLPDPPQTLAPVPSPLPNVQPTITPSPIPNLATPTPPTMAPIPTQTPRPTPEPQTQTPYPTTPTAASELVTLEPTTTERTDGPCDSRYQYCPTPTIETLAWKISPRNPIPTAHTRPIITRSTFDWDSEERNGLGLVITEASGGHWTEVEQNGQTPQKRWLRFHSTSGYGTSSVTSRYLQTMTSKACLEYKAVFSGQAALTIYMRQEGVVTAFSVHNHIGYPRHLGTIRLPVHNFMLTNIGFYVSFRGEVRNAGDYVTIDEVTLYNDNC